MSVGASGMHRADADVVAVEGDVEAADRHVGALDLAQHLGQPLRQRHAAGLQADRR